MGVGDDHIIQLQLWGLALSLHEAYEVQCGPVYSKMTMKHKDMDIITLEKLHPALRPSVLGEELCF